MMQLRKGKTSYPVTKAPIALVNGSAAYHSGQRKLYLAALHIHNIILMQVQTNAGYIFDQLTWLLDQLSDGQFIEKQEIFSGATIGKHYRHIIEFFQSVSLAEDTETICYDNRLRDSRIENNRLFARELLSDLKKDLETIDNDKPLSLVGDPGYDSENNTWNMRSSLLREFHYAVEHAIHHMAIIRMGIRSVYTEIRIGVEFGVAPSTLRFQKAEVNG